MWNELEQGLLREIMVKCDGIPGKVCPAKKAKNVRLGKGDLMMCEDCTRVRDYMDDGISVLPKEDKSKTGSNAGDAGACGGLQTTVSGSIIIFDPLLAYIQASLPSGTAENVKNAVLGHFTLEEIIKAKNELWSKCDDAIGEKSKRRGSATRQEKEAHLFDIINALSILDRKNQLPTIAVSAADLHRIPRSHPEELNPISQVYRLNRLEARMSSMVESMDHIIAEDLS